MWNLIRFVGLRAAKRHHPPVRDYRHPIWGH